MSLLPSRPEAEPAEDAGPRVVGVDSEDADEVLAALSSGTARSLLAALHEDPAPPSELADRVDTSLQNVQYHLEKLESAGAIEVVDTAYSAKGREMDVYAPADRPLVIFAGDEDQGSTLRTALTRLLGAVGVLGLASLVVQALFGRDGLLAAPSAPAGGASGDGGQGGDGGGGAFAGDSAATETVASGGSGGTGNVTADAATTEAARTAGTEAPTTTAEPELTGEPVQTTVDLATDAAGAGADPSAVPPGLLFFAGGLFVLAVVSVVLVARRW